MQASSLSFSRRGLVAGIVLAALAVAAHLPAAANGFVWDDNVLVFENPVVTGPAGMAKIWLSPASTYQYYPLTFTTFRLEYHLWGMNPLGYHLVNVFLHALTAVLAWRVLLFLGVPGAFAAAALFAAHPLHVESVAWISERKNVLSGALYLGAALCFLVRWGAGPGRKERGTGWYALGYLLFAGAVLAKSVAVTLPVGLAVLIWYARGRVTQREIKGLIPLVLLGLALGGLTMILEQTQVGAMGPPWNQSLLEKVLLAGRALGFYLGKLAWPHPLIFIYPRVIPDFQDAGSYLAPALAVVVFYAALSHRDRLGRGPAAALAWYAAALFPALGFFNVYPFLYSFVADHFAYLPSLGPLALAAGGAEAGFSRLRARGLPSWAPGAVLAVILVVLAGLSWVRIGDFRDFETLWQRTLEKNPDAWIAHGNLALVLEDQGWKEEAMAHRRKVVELAPDLAQGHYNLGVALFQKNDLLEAVRELALAVTLDGGHSSLNALGMVLVQLGRNQEAEQAFSGILEMNPNLPEAQYGMGMALAGQGLHGRAITHFARALSLWESRPGTQEVNEAEARRGMGRSLIALGQFREAVALFAEAAGLLPGDPAALYDLGVAREMSGDHAGAAAAFEEVLKVSPLHAGAMRDLGVVLMFQGRYSRAVELLSEAARLAPSPAPVLKNLAQAYCLDGREEEARATLTRLQALDPGLAGQTARLMKRECGLGAE